MKKTFVTAAFFVLCITVAHDLRAQTGPLQYFAVTPCRVVDTRNANGTNGGPILTENSQRDFRIRGNCGIPTTANYLIMVTIAAPALAVLGVPQLVSHFFVFYYGVLADITPPVAQQSPPTSAMPASRNISNPARRAGASASPCGR